MISRRGLSGLFGGVAAAPLVKALPAVAEPEIISRTWDWQEYRLGTYEAYSGTDELFTAASQQIVQAVTRNNAIIGALMEKRLYADKGVAAAEDTYEWDDDPDGGW